MAKHAMFDLVPFTGPRRKVTNMNWHVQPCREILQGHFPQTTTTTVASTAVGGDEQLRGPAISLRAHLFPPTTNRFCGEPGSVVIRPNADPAFVLRQVVDAIRSDSAQFLVDEVVDLD